MSRRLSALLVADAVGYSRRIEENESAALSALARSREIIDAAIAAHEGRVISTGGDSVIAEFASAVAAVSAAQELQRAIAASPEDVFAFRVGINFGDIAVSGSDILGDGLNIAARLEPLAPPGGIVISGVVADQVVGKIADGFAPVGRRRVKNIARPIEIFCWPEAAAGRMRRQQLLGRWPWALGALALAGAAAVGFGVIGPTEEQNMPTGPRIAVLPFEEVGVPAEQAFFAQGLSRDVNAFLSEFSNLFVLSPNATGGFSSSDCGTIRKELGADFILSGTVRRSENKLRVTTAFTKTEDCRQLNSPGPFDRDLSVDSVLDIQIDIARKVVSQIGSADAPIFDAAMIGAVANDAPETLTAYECVLLSYWFYENFDPDRHRRARDCLVNAVETDPEYSLAWSRLAFAHIESKKYAIDTQESWAEDALAAAKRAMDLDPANPDAYYALAIRSQMLGEDRTSFDNYARKAIELNPNDSFVLADLGTWMAYDGQWETGKEWVTRAKQLNPKHQSWWDWIWQLHAFLQDDYEASIAYAKIVNLPGNYMVQAALTAAYALNGDDALAEETLARVLELKPDYASDPKQPFRARGMQPQLIEKIMQGLRAAGLDFDE